MSTILDSLKKSSDQRNNSDKGSLDKFNFDNGKEFSSSFSKIIIVLFITLLLAGSLWVYQNYFASNASNSTNVEVTSEHTLEKNKDKTSTEPEKLILSNNAPKKEKPNSEIIKSQIKKLKEHQKEALREARLSDLNKSSSSFVNNNEEGKYNKIKSQRSLDKKREQEKNKNNRKKSNQGSKVKTLAQKEPALVQQENENIAQKPTTSTQQYRLLYQLPFAIRKEIPEIKLNIHIYDEKLENRIAIINGTRFAIDDMITEQILLKGILVNGILLDYNGNEFFVPN